MKSLKNQHAIKYPNYNISSQRQASQKRRSMMIVDGIKHSDKDDKLVRP